MDEFCNGDGMPYFMSVSLPFGMLLFSDFSGILKRGKISLKKTPIFKRFLGFLQGSVSLSLSKLQDIQTSEKLTSKTLLKANTRFVTSTAFFLSEF